MKTLMIAALLSLTTSALADTVLALEVKNYMNQKVESISFGVNENLGRAWVKATLSEQMFDESYVSEARGLVKGLSYDAESKTIVYDLNGEKVVCAKLVPQRFILGRVMKVVKTGRCTFTKQTVGEVWDTGYEMAGQTNLQILMTVQ